MNKLLSIFRKKQPRNSSLSNLEINYLKEKCIPKARTLEFQSTTNLQKELEIRSQLVLRGFKTPNEFFKSRKHSNDLNKGSFSLTIRRIANHKQTIIALYEVGINILDDVPDKIRTKIVTQLQERGSL